VFSKGRLILKEDEALLETTSPALSSRSDIQDPVLCYSMKSTGIQRVLIVPFRTGNLYPEGRGVAKIC
jgi:hypothetical protein